MDNKEKTIKDQKNSKNNYIENEQDKINEEILIQNKKIDDLKKELLEKQKQINDIELRKLANIANIKKSTEEKIKNIKKIEIENFLKEIIPIIDSLEDILTYSSKSHIKEQSLIKGIDLILQSLFNILNKLGVKIEGEKNQVFNSENHTPILIESSEKTEHNHIISVLKKGFSFNNVLLRKAIVTIPKK